MLSICKAGQGVTKTCVATLLLVLSTAVWAQQRNITGTVIDHLGEPLVGVAVQVKGSTVGTATDLNGVYQLNVPENARVLLFSYVGFVSQEVGINNRSEINIRLAEDIATLSEVTVTALGISREKKALGYAVGEVKGDNMTRISQENVLGALSGKVSGVQIQNTGGDPGSSSSVLIRGATSLVNDNQPLFVIDGVPVNNSLGNVSRLGNVNVDYGNAINDLNPSDVESVTVLKGASAAALYGSRAGNGVVLITTKSGSAKRPGIGVTVSSSIVFDKPVKFLTTQTRFASGAVVFSENQAIWYGPELDVGNEESQWSTGYEKAPLVSYPGKWEEFFSESGYTVDTNVGLTGNYDKGSFRLSYGNMQNQGIVLNTDMKRNTFNLSPVYKILPNLIASANVNISQSKSDNRPASGGSTEDPTVLMALETLPPHIDLHLLKDYWLTERMQQNSFATAIDNPYFLAHEMTNGFVRDRVFGNVKLDWEIIKNLSLMGRYSLDNYSEGRESKIPWSYSRRVNGGYGIQDDHHWEMNADFLLSYATSVSDVQINASVGGNLMSAEGRYLINRTEKLVIPGLYTLSNADGGLTTYSNGISKKVIYSLYGMATLSYKNMAYLDLTGRNDWSSTLPENNRSYFYPSASLSVLVNELVGIPTTQQMLKVRAGWAQVGNDTSPYSLYPSLQLMQDWGNVKRVNVPNSLLSPDLKPEIATSKEIGIDVSAFHNRVRLGATYYVSDNKNQILNISDLAPSSGYASKKINAGMVQSTGWELELGLVPIETKDMRWTVDFALTRNRTKVMSLTDGMDFITLYDADNAYARTMVGEYIGDIWGYDYRKVEDASSPYYGWPLLTGNKSIGFTLQQLTDEKSMVKVGNFNHDFLLGITTGFSWKSFTLAAQIDWRQGGDFFTATERRAINNGHMMKGFQGIPYVNANNLPAEIKANPERYFGNYVGGFTQDLGGFAYHANSQYYVYNRLIPYSGAFIPGVYEENGQYVENLGDPATTGYTVTPYAVADLWYYANLYIHDASFVKLREISLSCDLPKKWLQELYVQRLGLSLFCRNIMLWTANNIDFDPERAFNINNGVLQQGLEKYNLMPQTVSYGAKINIEF